MSKEKNIPYRIFLIIGIILLAVILLSIYFFGHSKKEKSTIVGVIVPGSVTEDGWNGVHYQGIEEACKKYNLKINLAENVNDAEACQNAIKELAKDGAKVIFLGSLDYSVWAKDMIGEYPEISFYGCSFAIDGDNCAAYFARAYQGRYLAGVLAGLKTTNNQLGYVAAFNNNEVNRGINAFTLGAKSVNSDVTVHVIYTNSWDDQEKEVDSVNRLIDEFGVDVMTYHQNQLHVIDTCEKKGIYSIGYNVYNLDEMEYSENVLSSVVVNWEMVYEEVLADYVKNQKITKDNYWIGLEATAVSLDFYSDQVSAGIREEVEAKAASIAMGQDVFYGSIYDNQGVLRCGEGEVIRDEVLLEQMDWLVEGVLLHE